MLAPVAGEEAQAADSPGASATEEDAGARPVRRRLTAGSPLPARTQVLLPFGVLVVLTIAWDTYVHNGASFATPRVEEVFAAFPGVVASGDMWRALGISDLSLFMGFVIAVLIGIPLGLLMGRARILDRVLSPYLDIAVVVPMAVMMPVVLMALGLTRTAQVVVIVVFALPFIVAATRGGARTIPAQWTDMARVFGASETRIWRLVVIPGSIAAVVAGLRLGFAQALTGLVTVELTLIALGIGQQLIHYQSHFESAQLFAFVGVLMIQSVLVMSVLNVVQVRVSRA